MVFLFFCDVSHAKFFWLLQDSLAIPPMSFDLLALSSLHSQMLLTLVAQTLAPPLRKQLPYTREENNTRSKYHLVSSLCSQIGCCVKYNMFAQFLAIKILILIRDISLFPSNMLLKFRTPFNAHPDGRMFAIQRSLFQCEGCPKWSHLKWSDAPTHQG